MVQPGRQRLLSRPIEPKEGTEQPGAPSLMGAVTSTSTDNALLDYLTLSMVVLSLLWLSTASKEVLFILQSWPVALLIFQACVFRRYLARNSALLGILLGLFYLRIIVF